jgi:hypothetical protein
MRDHSEWLDALEPSQLSTATQTPVARRKLPRGVLALLIALRIYVFIAAPLVVYAFIHALLKPQ